MNDQLQTSSLRPVLAWVRLPTLSVSSDVQFLRGFGYEVVALEEVSAVLAGGSGHTVKLIQVDAPLIPLIPSFGLLVGSVEQALSLAKSLGATQTGSLHTDDRGARWVHLQLPGGAPMDLTSRPPSWPLQV